MITDFDAEFDALPSASVQTAQPATPDTCNYKHLGVVLSASNRQVVAQLDIAVDPEKITLGSYAVVNGNAGQYLAMVTDVRSDSDRERVRRGPFTASKINSLKKAGALWTDLVLAPHLLQPTGLFQGWGPVRTVPTYLRDVRTATQEEISGVFGDPHQPGRFHIGAPLDMLDMALAIDMRRLCQRSVGLFGQSGTGKSFLGRMILAGVIKDRIASTLIFDMHNEYGWQGDSETGHKVKGLKQLFLDRVNIFTMDDESSRRRKSNPDMVVTIGMDQIEPADIEVLQSVLDLSDPGVGAVYVMARRLGDKWMEKFLDDDFIDNYGGHDEKALLSGKVGLSAFADAMGQPTNVLSAVRRKLDVFLRWGFIKHHAIGDPVDRMMRLLDAGNSVVLEFGRYGDKLDAYMFVANFLTRRIHARYVERKEAAFGDTAADPTPLMIVIEEAHKFLDPAVVHHTIFATIARELRKYNVTLFVIDQRPSQIDSEVMSQIATRISLLITNEKDVNAVLEGVSGADALRDVLARLDTKQQALILGHTVPIPVVIQTRTYDMDFYKSMGWKTDDELIAALRQNASKMRGKEDFDGFE